MDARPDKRPGQFKSQDNRAGSTLFVVPELVPGTLEKGYDIHQGLEAPLIRMLDFAQRYTVSIPWDDFDTARAVLETTHAFRDANEAESQGIRLVLPETSL
jgi:hypothetical protein